MLASTRLCFCPQGYMGGIKKWQCVLSLWARGIILYLMHLQAFQIENKLILSFSLFSFCSVIFSPSPRCVWQKLDQSDLLWSSCLVNLICPACEARLSGFSGHSQLISLQTLVLTLTSRTTSARDAGALGCASTVSVCCDLCQQMCCTLKLHTCK